MKRNKILDEIHISGLFLRCIIGINDDERVKKQDVLIDIVLFADLSRVCRSDSLEDTVDYKSVKNRIIQHVETSSYYLVERMAQAIADVCLDAEGVKKVRVSVEKPGALRFAKSVGIVITRER